MNKTHEKKIFSLEISTPKAAILKSQNFDLSNLEVNADDVGTFKVFVILSKEFLAQSEEGRGLVEFMIKDDKEEKKIQAVFISR